MSQNKKIFSINIDSVICFYPVTRYVKRPLAWTCHLTPARADGGPQDKPRSGTLHLCTLALVGMPLRPNRVMPVRGKWPLQR